MTYSSVVFGFATGLSTVGYQVFNFPAGTTFAARTTTGVTANGRSYGVNVSLPDGATYLIQWDDGNSPPNYATPDLVSTVNVTLSQPMSSPRALDSVADASVTLADTLWAGYAAGVGRKDASNGTTETIHTASTGTLLRTLTITTSSTNPWGVNFPVRAI